ncbi:HicB_like antitoxin of toxin-antitoxin system [Izhakiella capsodis]|uniref:HicB_like antitoxin of toxin-antitoxin system n=1 Tax=Izhakiella capsodis TaxID=1367852 RepID=A0A1I4X2D7_9GAMM|nr:HicB_like antitoxin of toxin-antitoxin system [Izhakiella capsodis]
MREAIDAHIELLVENGEAVPEATSVENWLADPDYAGVLWALFDVDVTRLMGKVEKINVTLPSLLIRRIDQFVAAHPEYGSRSGFLSRVAADKVIGREKR